MLSLNLLLAALELGVPFKALLHLSSAFRMLSVVLVTANLPEVGVEGGLAFGKVLLRLESLLIR